MNVLAIDAALGAFSTAVASDGTILASATAGGNVALESGLARVAATLAQARVRADMLDRLAVGVGPGTFTGLRIAIAFAKSLAQAWERPLVAVSSFDLLEYGTDFERVLTIVVGRPGVISARYRAGTEIARASGNVRAALAAVLPDGLSTLTVVGASKDVLAALAERRILVQSVQPHVTPPAAAAALIAASGEAPSSVHAVRADYGELPAAKVPKR